MIGRLEAGSASLINDVLQMVDERGGAPLERETLGKILGGQAVRMRLADEIEGHGTNPALDPPEAQ
jgi:hypothetical protein